MKKRLSIPLLLCFAGLAWALLTAPPVVIAPTAPPVEPAAEVPDSYASVVALRSFDENGRLLDRTEAAQLRRYLGRGVTEFEAPARFGHDGKTGWVATAAHGELLEASEVLQLSGDVRLRYEAEGVEFHSASMAINLAEGIARSRDPVRVWQGEQETVANRLYVELEREVAVLTGNVRSILQPNRRGEGTP
ncbi:MAG: LPS export ABC transporter periplasmic protein LptC [Halieaceae bacterium]|jgi:LPS export ABC transporter protein LptC|nr:LPS export ABC transporter periplasmic protein LptC [Halieaceae bacterium]